jgi:hypothetical protein
MNTPTTKTDSGKAPSVEDLRAIVNASNKRVDELLALVPNKRFSDCSPAEQMRFTNLELALTDSRIATRNWREAKFSSQIRKGGAS